MSELPTVPLVLVADADAASRTRRARQLEGCGYRVSVARTLFEAIVKASCHVPDVIVLDDSFGDDDVQETSALLSTCPATAHIRILRVRSGSPLPKQMVG